MHIIKKFWQFRNIRFMILSKTRFFRFMNPIILTSIVMYQIRGFNFFFLHNMLPLSIHYIRLTEKKYFVQWFLCCDKFRKWIKSTLHNNKNISSFVKDCFCCKQILNRRDPLYKNKINIYFLQLFLYLGNLKWKYFTSY